MRVSGWMAAGVVVGSLLSVACDDASLIQLPETNDAPSAPPVTPFQSERCDGIDNDRDPTTPDGADEASLGEPCDGTDDDLCPDGVLRCESGTLRCSDDSEAAVERCDGIDNDCDPATPDGAGEPLFGESCDGADADLCDEGAWQCEGGALRCSDHTDDAIELCDGTDNDCDPSTPDGAAELAVPTLSACPTSWDRRPVVEFDPLPDGHVYELYLDAEAHPYATVRGPGQNYHRPAAPIAAGAAPPGASASIYAVACIESEHACCGASATVAVQLVEECAEPIPPTPDNILISEYVTDGDGSCPGAACEAGEAFEITNLSHCPVDLSGYHMSYCNPGSCTTTRWMNFDHTAVVPPRGVYVAIRAFEQSRCDYPFFETAERGLHGLNVSILSMESEQPLASGWFNNQGGGKIRIASGPFVDMAVGQTFSAIPSYLGEAAACESVGFDAFDACGNVSSAATPSEVLAPNQLGRLWHPCDAVVDPQPTACR